ncbi:MAG: amidohydrolase [Bacteroidia bacterium]|nr:amidohydrolase [Bacteroidia bacterium]
MKKYIVIFCSILFFSCSHQQEVDLIVHHAVIYTVDSSFSNAQAFAVKDGKFIAVGSDEEILSKFVAKETLDANGKSIYPGFIDSHCHFYEYGRGLQEVDLVGTQSFDEVIERVKAYSKTNQSDWIIGRGWDQNDWEKKEYPDRYQLDKLFPNTPVFLERIDGHAALANAEALRRAHVKTDTKISGGVIEIDLISKEQGGEEIWLEKELASEVMHLNYPIAMPSGILVDNAVQLVKKAIPNASPKEIEKALLAAEKNCLAVGLTTVDDAGLMRSTIQVIDEMQKAGSLKMRIYAMLSDSTDNLEYYLKKGPYKTDRLNVRSFKFYVDGALGSRGACLMQPYSDMQDEQGFLLNTTAYFDSMAIVMRDKGFQMNSHCIGDSAVRQLRLTYFNTLVSNSTASPAPMSFRWRIEHAQVVDVIDQKFFSGMIPSVQPTHATSDMYWAKDRLGENRVKYAYAYNDLLKACGMLALGTDFPVEHISPFYTFYAAVARKDLKGFPKDGFQMENALSRENTLRGMTIWGAYANFEEKEKGSIEAGKFADFIMLDTDIMKCEIDKVPHAKVLHTFINGEKVYSMQ